MPHEAPQRAVSRPPSAAQHGRGPQRRYRLVLRPAGPGRAVGGWYDQASAINLPSIGARVLPHRLGVARPERDRGGTRRSNPSRALISLLLTLGLAVLFLPAGALAGPPKPPASSCLGTDACTGNTGGLGANACVGDLACFNNAGSVAKDACHG